MKSIPNLIRQFKEYMKIKKFHRENKWVGLVPGDLVEYGGKKLMYRGINKNGGPGGIGPEPMFGPSSPSEFNCVYYLRHTDRDPLFPDDRFPDNIFSENAKPIMAGSSGIYIGFINATRSHFKKVGHVTQKEWNVMLNDLKLKTITIS